jgi:hypothetical protein
MNRIWSGTWNRVLRCIGPLGVAAAALALVAALVALWIPQLDLQGEALRSTLENRVRNAPKVAPVVAVRRVPLGQQVSEFVDSLPPLNQYTSDLEGVFKSARTQKLSLLRGEYQLKQEPNAPLVVFTATFPVTADYAAIKAFTADVLKELPHVSMDELRMSRASAGSTALESTIRFSFVYRSN